MKRPPSVVHEQRALAAQRLGEQEAVVDERGRVELHELEVGERGAGAVGEREPLAERAGRVRRPLPERGVAAGREQRRARADGAAVGEHAGAAAVGLPERDDALVLDERDPRVLAHARGERGRDRLARLGAARVRDAADASGRPRGRGRRRTRRRPSTQVGDPRRRLLGQHADGALAAEPAAGAQRVLGVQRRTVVVGERRGDAALRVPAVRGRDRRLREQEHVRLVGRAQRRVEPGDSPADDDQTPLPPRFSPQSR